MGARGIDTTSPPWDDPRAGKRILMRRFEELGQGLRIPNCQLRMRGTSHRFARKDYNARAVRVVPGAARRKSNHRPESGGAKCLRMTFRFANSKRRLFGGQGPFGGLTQLPLGPQVDAIIQSRRICALPRRALNEWKSFQTNAVETMSHCRCH